jgi:putative ABC transport system ATP-binding protein
MVGDQEVHALCDIDLSVQPGDYVSLMGPSGSGKSTLLNVIGLLDRPDAGRYALGGIDTTELDDRELARLRRERIGFVFQSFHLIARLTTAQNIGLPLELLGIAGRERQARVREQMQALGLQGRADHRPEQLSGGERQRAAIARAMITRPAILLADEPTGNLDRATGVGVVDALEHLNDQGITLVVVTHDPAIGQRARRRLRMEDGRLLPEKEPTR